MWWYFLKVQRDQKLVTYLGKTKKEIDFWTSTVKIPPAESSVCSRNLNERWFVFIRWDEDFVDSYQPGHAYSVWSVHSFGDSFLWRRDELCGYQLAFESGPPIPEDLLGYLAIVLSLIN